MSQSIPTKPAFAGPRMGVRTMLTAFTVAAVATSVVVGAVAIYDGHQMKAGVDRALVAKDVVADILPPPLYLVELRLVVSQAVEGSMPAEQAQAEFKRLKSEYEARVRHWQANPPYGLQAKLLGAQHEAGQRVIAAAAKVLDLVSAKADMVPVRDALVAMHGVYLVHRTGVDVTVKEANAFADSSLAASEAQAKAGDIKETGVLVLSAALLVGLGLWIRRKVWASVGGEPQAAAAVASAVARGDLQSAIDVAHDDHASVMAQLNSMQHNLSEVVRNVRLGADSVATASAEIAQGNLDLSQRTEQQASALEETAASMEQLNATVKQNADNARQANQLAQSASRVAVQGGEVVGQVVGTMKGINDSSRKIADIISVIDGIAFQTNILALNAAVEAARAGEQGRGFAVVASEVRSLAGRSADAAKEIKALIGASVERVEQGSKLVDQAGATMTEVVASIRRVTDIMGEISAASNEQSAGVAQVGEAITQMDQVTQQNAALVEQSAAAAQSLKDQAAQLVQAVAVFKLADDGASDESGVYGVVASKPQREIFPGAERRGPNRSKNVQRLPTRNTSEVPTLTAKAPTRKTGTDDGWESF